MRIHPWSLPGWAPEPESETWREQLKGYFAALTAMDANIGRILDRVEALVLRESTLIWFLGDNGFNCGHHGLWGKGNSSFPLNMYDESVLVPAIASHPGAIPEGVVASGMVSGCDFAPTLLEYVGLDMPGADRLPGRSFRRLLYGEANGERGRHHVVVFDEYGPVQMIRSEEWKYVHRYPYGPHELYDPIGDPRERVNLAESDRHQERVVEMRGLLQNWRQEYVDPAVDGARETVTGAGQWNLAGAANKGRPAFNQA